MLCIFKTWIVDLPVKNDCISSNTCNHDDDVKEHKEISWKWTHDNANVVRIVDGGLINFKHGFHDTRCLNNDSNIKNSKNKTKHIRVKQISRKALSGMERG